MPDDDPPKPYRLSDEPPPRRRYRPMPGARASSERGPDPFDEPALKRFFGTDPFPWALALGVLLWIGLALGARAWIGCAALLVLAGFAVIILSQVWLYLSIFLDDADSGLLALVSGWYRTFYLYSNPELVWRPAVLTLLGLVMIVTGGAVGAAKISGR
jgi:hypothetical protein